jgi:hypothetical protein
MYAPILFISVLSSLFLFVYGNKVGPVAYQVDITLHDHESGAALTKPFSLYYGMVMYWRAEVDNFIAQWTFGAGTTGDRDRAQAVEKLSEHVEAFLKLRQYPPEMVAGKGGMELPREMVPNAISAGNAVFTLLHTAYTFPGTGVYDFAAMRDRGVHTASAPAKNRTELFQEVLSSQGGPVLPNGDGDGDGDGGGGGGMLLSLGNTEVAQHYGMKENPVHTISTVLSRYGTNSNSTGEKKEEGTDGGGGGNSMPTSTMLGTTFIIYQTRFADTGGTTALRILYVLCSSSSFLSCL